MPEEKVTFCRICKPLCGMVATVEEGRITKLRPDPDHPLSRGYACPKGIAMAEVQNDPDRIMHPLRRVRRGEFERVSWKSRLATSPPACDAYRRRAWPGTWATPAPSPTRMLSG